MNAIFFVLLSLLSIGHYEDNSKALEFAAYPIYSVCTGELCTSIPELPTIDSPFKYTGETPIILESN